MHRLDYGGWLLDTPGMRELQLSDAGAVYRRSSTTLSWGRKAVASHTARMAASPAAPFRQQLRTAG